MILKKMRNFKDSLESVLKKTYSAIAPIYSSFKKTLNESFDNFDSTITTAYSNFGESTKHKLLNGTISLVSLAGITSPAITNGNEFYSNPTSSQEIVYEKGSEEKNPEKTYESTSKDYSEDYSKDFVTENGYYHIEEDGDTIVQAEKHVVKNLKGEIINHISYQDAIKNNLVYSPKEDAFYSKEISEKVMDELKNSKGFYGDQVLNPFKQPNVLNEGEFHLNYYGSGSKGDDVIDYNDYLAMQSGVQVDEYDVDGDGIASTLDDQELVYNYITDQIPYLPAHWEVLKTENEKTTWHEKTIEIDKTDTITYVPGYFECGNFSMQFSINFAGVENISNSNLNFEKYDTTQNARFNGSAYCVTTQATNGEFHAINGIYVGSSTLNFEDIYFSEPQTDDRVFPGDFSMDPNSFANIKRYAYIWSEFLQQYVHGTVPLINFDLENGVAISATPQHPDVVLEKPIIHYNIGGQNPSDITVNVEDPLTPDFTGSPGAPDWATEFYSDSTNRNPDVWNPGHWNYTLLRDHKAVSNENPIIDTTYSSLELSVLIPDYNRPAQEITVQDTTAPWFTHVYDEDIPYSENLQLPLPEGEDNCGYFLISRIDSISGKNPDSTVCEYYDFPITVTDEILDPSNLWADTTYTIQVVKPMSIVYDTVPGAITIGKYDSMHPDETGWADGTDTIIPWFEVGQNYWDELIDSTATEMVYHRHWTLEDLCGQLTNDTIQPITRDMTTSIAENKNLKSFLGNPFPNPTNGKFKLEYNLLKNQRISGEIYNNNLLKNQRISAKIYNNIGQLVEHFSEEQFTGENILELDISDKAKGMYFLEVSVDGESVGTKKVVKQ